MKRNIVVFLIIIILFIVLTLVGFLIYYVQNGYSFGRPSSVSDEEEGEEPTEESMRAARGGDRSPRPLRHE
ncbi:hypothetical protein EV356DRAFT_528097 [Viridothelium virens]|uniref:Uncharacterized protein n=1 Tax=Viridothelium virens TaxID=1048519 RepID=A0A6A6HNX4_VIRVR|nr:hypothetical protein EV356DRAFT_528097 [Viridothelium virens]